MKTWIDNPKLEAFLEKLSKPYEPDALFLMEAEHWFTFIMNGLYFANRLNNPLELEYYKDLYNLFTELIGDIVDKWKNM